MSLFIWFPGRVLLNIGKPSSDKCITTFDEVLGNVNILYELFTASKMFIKGLKLHYLEVWILSKSGGTPLEGLGLLSIGIVSWDYLSATHQGSREGMETWSRGTVYHPL